MLIKFTLESYEDLGIVRTLDAEEGVLVILALKNSEQVVREILESVRDEFGLAIVPQPTDLSSDWLFEALRNPA